MAYLYWIHLEHHKDMFKEGYIGITERTVAQRAKQHKSASNSKKYSHYPFYRAIRKYGFESFVVETLVEGSAEYVAEMEMRLRPTPGIGYNIAVGGNAVGLGRVWTEESRARATSAAKKRNESEELRMRISRSLTGKVQSEETVRKRVEKTKGLKRSEETKARMSKAFKGREVPNARRKAISESLKGRKMSEDQLVAQIKRMQENGPWGNPKANHHVWALADELHILSQMYNETQIATLWGLPRSNFLTIYAKLKSGWNPLEDEAWLSFKAEYEKEKNEQP